MFFSSPIFLFLFLPAGLACTALPGLKLRNLLLPVFSIVFYARGQVIFGSPLLRSIFSVSSSHGPVMFLVEAEAKPLLQFQHDAMFFFARGKLVIRVVAENSLRLRQTVPEIQFGADSEACNQAFWKPARGELA